MPRPRRSIVTSPDRVRELCIRYGIDPFEEMVKMYRETIPIPEGVDPEVLKPMMERYDIITMPDGKKRLQHPVRERTDLMKECAKYVYAQKRATETREEKDFKLTVLIQTFGKEEPKRVEVVDVTPQLTQGTTNGTTSENRGNDAA